MIKRCYLITCCILFTAIHCGIAQNVIFLHHSIGNNLFNQGNVAGWFDNYNQANGKSFHVVERTYPDSPWPWNNFPYDYWKLWIGGGCDSDNPNIECLNTLAANYDMVIFKHCAPGATIYPDNNDTDITSSFQTMANYQLQYRALRALFDSYPDTKFMVWTLAPWHRLSTNPEDAQRANEFVQWVKNDWLTEDGMPHPNIYEFDFFSLVAELDENPANGVRYCLKYDYEGSHTDADSHPNLAANELIGPLFSQAIVDAFAEVQPTSLEPNSIEPLNIIMNDQELRVQLNDYNKKRKISFYNLLGNLVISEAFESNVCVLNISSLPAGIYILEVSDADKSKTMKVSKP
jgi:hypothetical protein